MRLGIYHAIIKIFIKTIGFRFLDYAATQRKVNFRQILTRYTGGVVTEMFRGN